MAGVYSERGLTGLTRFGGLIYEEWLKELQGSRGAKVYKEMRDNDAIIGSFLFAIEMLIRKVSWRAEASNTTPEAIEQAKFIESCLADMKMTWNDIVSEILSFLTFGWSLMEICYKIRDGAKSSYDDYKIGWAKWGIRAQETLTEWIYNSDNELTGMKQMAAPDYIERIIPIEKSLLFRTRSNKENK